jgi:hypothetical protein
MNTESTELHYPSPFIFVAATGPHRDIRTLSSPAAANYPFADPVF